VKEKDANQALEILKFTISKSSLKNLEYRLIDKENKNDFD
jgi:hypothetical protein